jgi:hypothetical protein
MIIVGALGVIAGLALAERFGVLILLPAIMLAMAGTILFEVATHHAFVQAWLNALCVAVGLQLGFIGRGFFWSFLNSTTRHADLLGMKCQDGTAPSPPVETNSPPEANAGPTENTVHSAGSRRGR